MTTVTTTVTTTVHYGWKRTFSAVSSSRPPYARHCPESGHASTGQGHDRHDPADDLQPPCPPHQPTATSNTNQVRLRRPGPPAHGSGAKPPAARGSAPWTPTLREAPAVPASVLPTRTEGHQTAPARLGEDLREDPDTASITPHAKCTPKAPRRRNRRGANAQVNGLGHRCRTAALLKRVAGALDLDCDRMSAQVEGRTGLGRACTTGRFGRTRRGILSGRSGLSEELRDTDRSAV